MWEEVVLTKIIHFHRRTTENHDQSHSGVLISGQNSNPVSPEYEAGLQTFCVGTTTAHYSLFTYLSIQGVAQKILIVEKTLGNLHFIFRFEMHIQNFITLLSRSDPVAQVPQCHVQQLLQILPIQASHYKQQDLVY